MQAPNTNTNPTPYKGFTALRLLMRKYQAAHGVFASMLVAAKLASVRAGLRECPDLFQQFESVA